MILTSQGKNSKTRWDMIMNELGDVKGKTLVDIGCESGYFCEAFIRNGGASAHGVEIADEFISNCKSLNLPNFTVTKELPDKDFDICFYLSLHYHEGIDYLNWCRKHSMILFIETSGNPTVTSSYNNRLKIDLCKIYDNVKELGITEYAGRMMYLCY